MVSKSPRTTPKSAPAKKTDKAPASAQAITDGKKQVEKALETKATLVGDLEKQVQVLLFQPGCPGEDWAMKNLFKDNVDIQAIEDGGFIRTLRGAVSINGLYFDLLFVNKDNDEYAELHSGDCYDDGEQPWKTTKCYFMLELSENIRGASLWADGIGADELMNRIAESVQEAQKKLACFSKDNIYFAETKDEKVFEIQVRFFCEIDGKALNTGKLPKSAAAKMIRECLAEYGIR